MSWWKKHAAVRGCSWFSKIEVGGHWWQIIYQAMTATTGIKLYWTVCMCVCVGRGVFIHAKWHIFIQMKKEKCERISFLVPYFSCCHLNVLLFNLLFKFVVLFSSSSKTSSLRQKKPAKLNNVIVVTSSTWNRWTSVVWSVPACTCSICMYYNKVLLTIVVIDCGAKVSVEGE